MGYQVEGLFWGALIVFGYICGILPGFILSMASIMDLKRRNAAVLRGMRR
jgi:hypothetical protein